MSSIECSLHNKEMLFITLFWVVNNIFYQYVAFNYLKKVTICDIGRKVLYNLSVVCVKARKQQHIHLPNGLSLVSELSYLSLVSQDNYLEIKFENLKTDGSQMEFISRH